MFEPNPGHQPPADDHEDRTESDAEQAARSPEISAVLEGKEYFDIAELLDDLRQLGQAPIKQLPDGKVLTCANVANRIESAWNNMYRGLFADFRSQEGTDWEVFISSLSDNTPEDQLRFITRDFGLRGTVRDLALRNHPEISAIVSLGVLRRGEIQREVQLRQLLGGLGNYSVKVDESGREAASGRQMLTILDSLSQGTESTYHRLDPTQKSVYLANLGVTNKYGLRDLLIKFIDQRHQTAQS